MKKLSVGMAAVTALLGVSIGGCATTSSPGELATTSYRHSNSGTVVYREEFEFVPPTKEWKRMEGVGVDEFMIAFLKRGDCPSLCLSTFAYDEEPYGYSRDLDTRVAEFYQRFLWAARVKFGDIHTQSVPVLGGVGLAASAEGSEPVRQQKVMTELILGKRGERVVAFYYSQWRPMEGAYDPRDLEEFESFARSFRLLKESFYEKNLTD
ncbi:MAG: hypothetical protein P1P84_09130 [Deferrisomatales bacterium]|nr:hypothetical protein [Deferrisomatales bacterium]